MTIEDRLEILTTMLGVNAGVLLANSAINGLKYLKLLPEPLGEQINVVDVTAAFGLAVLALADLVTLAFVLKKDS